jgi:hypothetical protein
MYPEIWDSWLINWKREFRDSDMVASPQVLVTLGLNADGFAENKPWRAASS